MKQLAIIFVTMAAAVIMFACCHSSHAGKDKEKVPEADVKVLTAAESDPRTIGWMQGFPPAHDKTLNSADGSYFTFPALRYSVNHMREFFPTRDVPASDNFRYTVETDIDANIENVMFLPWGADEEISLRQSLDTNYVDGMIVMHKGKIVYETYSGGLTPDGLHAAMSVSKSFTGTLGAILACEGVIDPEKKVTGYIPELSGSGFGDATVRQVMDMTTALQYSEDYSDPDAEIWAYSASGNVFRGADYKGPENYYEYLKTVKKISGAEHGEAFGYRTINTELLGWIISRASGKNIAELVSERIWKPLGAHYSGYYQLGSSGITFAGGGFNLNLRDMAMFGEMMRCNGKLGGRQIIPEKAVEDIRTGGSNPESQARFARGGYDKLKGWSYRDMWWITNNSHGAFMARGVYGQAIYIDPVAEMVIARFASNYLASNTHNDPFSIPAYEAVAEYLMNKGKTFLPTK
ncbi:MAG: serine hydrolase domain-containing protein [Candidatus Aphodosoma sp.]